MKHKDGLDIAALLLLLLVAIAVMVVPVALTQPALLAVPAVLVLIALCVVLYQRRRLRAFLARQLCSTDFENSRIQYSLANLPIPTVLVNDGRILWYNQYFRQDVLNDYDAVTRPVNRVLPELDLAVCSRPHGQDLKVGERRFTAYAGSAKGSRGASLVYLINDTLYKETLDEYNESRPACLIIVIDSYDELFDDMKDSEQAKELEAINSLLEKYIGRSTGFLRKVTRWHARASTLPWAAAVTRPPLRPLTALSSTAVSPTASRSAATSAAALLPTRCATSSSAATALSSWGTA